MSLASFSYHLKLLIKLLIKLYLAKYYFLKNKNKIHNLKKNLKENNRYLALLNVSSIGALASQINYFNKFSIINNLSLEKSFYFLASDKKISNNFFMNKISQELDINFDDILYKSLLLPGNLNQFKKEKILIEFKNDFVNYLPTKNFKINLTNQDINDAKKIFNKLGLDFEKKIVAFGIKNNFYWKQKYEIDKNWDIYRMSSIENIKESLNYLLSKDFQTVLLGDYSNSDILKVKDCNICTIEKLTKVEREIFDIVIFEKLSFACFGAIGLRFVAELFNVPIVSHNGFLPQWQSDGIFLPKLIRYKKNKKIVPLRNLIQKKFINYDLEDGFLKIRFLETLVFRNQLQFDLKKLEVVENSSREILNAIKELEDFILSKKKNLDIIDIEYQDKVRNIFFNNSVFSKSEVNYGVNFGGYYSINFLKNYKNYTD